MCDIIKLQADVFFMSDAIYIMHG